MHSDDRFNIVNAQHMRLLSWWCHYSGFEVKSLDKDKLECYLDLVFPELISDPVVAAEHISSISHHYGGKFDLKISETKLVAPDCELVRYLRPLELQRLFEYKAYSPLNTIARMMFASGLKLVELLRMRVGDLDGDCQEVIIPDRRGELKSITIPPSIRGQLCRLIHKRSVYEHLFTLDGRRDRIGHPIVNRTFFKFMNEASSCLLLGRLNVALLRGTHIVYSMKNGKSPGYIKKDLGIRSNSVLVNYLELDTVNNESADIFNIFANKKKLF